MQDAWIIPNMGYRRNALSGNLTNGLTEKLTLSTKISYNHRGSDNLPNSGYNNQSYMYFVRGITPSMDAAWFADNWRPGRYGIEQTTPFSNLLDNPRTMSYDMINSQDKNHVIGHLQADYRFSRKLNLMVRGGLDFSCDTRSQTRPFDTYRYASGYYREQGVYSQEFNTGFLLTYANNRHGYVRFGVNAGGSAIVNTYDREEAWTNELTTPKQYNFANSAIRLTYNPYFQRYAVSGLYALANVGYRDVLFLDATSRLDYASTLASPQKRTVVPFFYPSVNASALLTGILYLPEQIRFWKLRASVGGGGKLPSVV